MPSLGGSHIMTRSLKIPCTECNQLCRRKVVTRGAENLDRIYYKCEACNHKVGWEDELAAGLPPRRKPGGGAAATAQPAAAPPPIDRATGRTQAPPSTAPQARAPPRPATAPPQYPPSRIPSDSRPETRQAQPPTKPVCADDTDVELLFERPSSGTAADGKAGREAPAAAAALGRGPHALSPDSCEDEDAARGKVGAAAPTGATGAGAVGTSDGEKMKTRAKTKAQRLAQPAPQTGGKEQAATAATAAPAHQQPSAAAKTSKAGMSPQQRTHPLLDLNSNGAAVEARLRDMAAAAKRKFAQAFEKEEAAVPAAKRATHDTPAAVAAGGSVGPGGGVFGARAGMQAAAGSGSAAAPQQRPSTAPGGSTGMGGSSLPNAAGPAAGSGTIPSHDHQHPGTADRGAAKPRNAAPPPVFAAFSTAANGAAAAPQGGSRSGPQGAAAAAAQPAPGGSGRAPAAAAPPQVTRVGSGGAAATPAMAAAAAANAAQQARSVAAAAAAAAAVQQEAAPVQPEGPTNFNPAGGRPAVNITPLSPQALDTRRLRAQLAQANAQLEATSKKLIEAQAQVRFHAEIVGTLRQRVEPVEREVRELRAKLQQAAVREAQLTDQLNSYMLRERMYQQQQSTTQEQLHAFWAQFRGAYPSVARQYGGAAHQGPEHVAGAANGAEGAAAGAGTAGPGPSARSRRGTDGGTQGVQGGAPPPPEPPPAAPQPQPQPDDAAMMVFAQSNAPALDENTSIRALKQFLSEAGAESQARLCSEKAELLVLARERINSWEIRRALACSKVANRHAGDLALFRMSAVGGPKAALTKTYREFRIRLHPDKNPKDELATPAFQYLQEAHQRLSAMNVWDP